MKEATMYQHNPNSAESVLTEKLKDISHGWFDNQRAVVLEAMQAYADQQVNKVVSEIIGQVEAYPMFPEEKQSWVKYLRTLKIKQP